MGRHASGEHFEPVPGGNKWAGSSSVPLADAFKAFQRKSKGFNELWATYCDSCGNGKHDPSKQSEDFLVSFLEGVSRQGSMSLMGGFGAMPPMKRPRDALYSTDSSANAWGGGAWG